MGKNALKKQIARLLGDTEQARMATNSVALLKREATLPVSKTTGLEFVVYQSDFNKLAKKVSRSILRFFTTKREANRAKAQATRRKAIVSKWLGKADGLREMMSGYYVYCTPFIIPDGMSKSEYLESKRDYAMSRSTLEAKAKALNTMCASVMGSHRVWFDSDRGFTGKLTDSDGLIVDEDTYRYESIKQDYQLKLKVHTPMMRINRTDGEGFYLDADGKRCVETGNDVAFDMKGSSQGRMNYYDSVLVRSGKSGSRKLSPRAVGSLMTVNRVETAQGANVARLDAYNKHLSDIQRRAEQGIVIASPQQRSTRSSVEIQAIVAKQRAIGIAGLRSMQELDFINRAKSYRLRSIGL